MDDEEETPLRRRRLADAVADATETLVWRRRADHLFRMACRVGRLARSCAWMCCWNVDEGVVGERGGG